MKVAILNNYVELLPGKALFLPDSKTLILGDLHFGKINHFRRAGLPVPFGANRKNTESLIDLLTSIKPLRTIFLGDLFHSYYNEEWETVGQIVRHFSACQFELVRGNHDIMSAQQYDRYKISVCDHLELGPFYLTHEPMPVSAIPPAKINVAGHLHPGANLQGKGRQAITLPCFWLSKNQMILPAFGSFTGLAIVRPEATDRVFAILNDSIVEVPLAAKESKAKFVS